MTDLAQSQNVTDSVTNDDQANYVQIDYLADIRRLLTQALRSLDDYERQLAAERTATPTVSPCQAGTVWIEASKPWQWQYIDGLERETTDGR